MVFRMLPPRHQLVEILTRIYQQRLTTTSGGNLSIKDEDGNIWITPAGVDKGTLTLEDIVCIQPDGKTVGRHRPSTEFPFHQQIYQARPDLRAIVHAHPLALVAWSITRKTPNTALTPHAHHLCGQVGYAPYALTGTPELGTVIANTFEQGYNVVMLENHGVVTAGTNLLEAFHRFESLEFIAQTQALAQRVGTVKSLRPEQLEAALQTSTWGMLQPHTPAIRELELRQALCKMAHRAYDQSLIIGTIGTLSARLEEDSFLITPKDVDRRYLSPEDIILVRGNAREAGKMLNRAARLHQAIYARQPHVQFIISAQPPHALAFAISDAQFDTRLIPESYIVLRDLPRVPYDWLMTPDKIAETLTAKTPICLIENDAVVATGASLLQAFDRLEVAEFSAQAMFNSLSIGEIVPIEAEHIEALKQKFQL